MNYIFQAENEELLKSIIETEKWNEAPEEENFFKTLGEIEKYSTPEFQDIAKKFIIDFKKVSYDQIRIDINTIINSK